MLCVLLIIIVEHLGKIPSVQQKCDSCSEVIFTVPMCKSFLIIYTELTLLLACFVV